MCTNLCLSRYLNCSPNGGHSIWQWRDSWECASSTHRRRLAQLKTFFTHAVREGWIKASPFTGMRAPKAESSPTLPLTRSQMRQLLRAAADKPRERALILLMRYSGLAIRDAATLSRSALEPSGEVVVRRAKTGELVTVLLPEEVIRELESVAAPKAKYFFWTGKSAKATAAKYWRERLNRVARAAGIEGFKPHRLRDTFAVELLLAGVKMQDVSTLLGHRSVRTTERYYAPWNRDRRHRLVSIVDEAHRQDLLLRELYGKKAPRTVGAARREECLATLPNKQSRPADDTT